MKCAATWREDDGELAECVLEEHGDENHQWRNVIASPARGWAIPRHSTLAHYFVGGVTGPLTCFEPNELVSLCFRWTYVGELDARADGAVSGDDCVACTRRLASHRAPDRAQTMPGGAVLPSGALPDREPGGTR